MNERHRASSSSLFLMELILAILLFCIASTICISIFVRSHTLNREAQTLNLAISRVSDASELILSCDSREQVTELLTDAYGISIPDGETVSIPLDAGMDVTKDDPAYLLAITFSGDEALLQADIRVQDAETETAVYEVDIEHNISGGEQ